MARGSHEKGARAPMTTRLPPSKHGLTGDFVLAGTAWGYLFRVPRRFAQRTAAGGSSSSVAVIPLRLWTFVIVFVIFVAPVALRVPAMLVFIPPPVIGRPAMLASLS